MRSTASSIRSFLRPRTRLARLLGRPRWPTAEPAAAPTDGPRIDFRCNICGASNQVPFAALQREQRTCTQCDSTVRDRTMVHLLTSALLGRSTALPDLPQRRDLRGLGLSDSRTYARPLKRTFSYTNTYFHARPKLDITNVAARHDACYDFITSSDVFEHVAPPVARAFSGARRLLKPGGVLVFSVPFSLDADTIEHFPDLHDFRVIESPAGWRLENRTADGRSQTFTDLVFHGGPGTTLEMRVFSRAGLERAFAAAGFTRVRIADEPFLEFGIAWPQPWSVPMVAYA